MNKYIYVCVFSLALLSWLIPNYYQPWLAAYPNALALSGSLLLFIWLAAKRTVYAGSALFLLPTVLLLVVVQYFFGVSPFVGEVVVFSVYVLAFALAYLTGFNLSLNKSSQQTIAKGLAVFFVVGAVISSWIALLQWQQLNGSIWIRDLAPGGRPYANFGQPNNMATALGMGLAGVLYLFESRVIQRTGATALATFIIIALALAQSRTTWLAGIAVVVFWAWQARRSNIKLRLKPIVLLMWYMLFVSFLFLLPWLNELLLISGPDLLSHAKTAHRWHMWQQFALAIWHGPWYGYGVSQVAEAQVAIAPSFPLVGLMTFYTHSLVLDVLIWFGPFIGGILVILGGCGLVRLGFSVKTVESRFALIAAGFVLTHSLLEYPHAYLFFLLPLGVLLGMAATEYPGKRLFTLPRKVTIGAVACLMLLGSWIIIEYIIIENDYRLMRFEVANIGKVKAEKAAPDVMLLTQLREYTRLARTEPYAGMSNEELAWMRQVVYQYPYSASLSRYVKALALNDQTDEALHHLQVLKGLHQPKYYESVIGWLKSEQENHQAIKKILARLNENN